MEKFIPLILFLVLLIGGGYLMCKLILAIARGVKGAISFTQKAEDFAEKAKDAVSQESEVASLSAEDVSDSIPGDLSVSELRDHIDHKFEQAGKFVQNLHEQDQQRRKTLVDLVTSLHKGLRNLHDFLKAAQRNAVKWSVIGGVWTLLSAYFAFRDRVIEMVLSFLQDDEVIWGRILTDIAVIALILAGGFIFWKKRVHPHFDEGGESPER